MSQAPKISIVINCYNGEAYLAEAIQSVLDQTYDDWELIVWDNQSKDKTAEIAKSFTDPRIRYVLADEHVTLSRGRNLAARIVRGEWLGYLDCDDLFEPNKLANQMALLDSAPKPEDVGLIYCRAKVLGGPRDGQDLNRAYVGKPLPQGKILRELLLVQNFVPLVAALVRTKDYRECGGIPEDYVQCEDYYLFCDVARQSQALASDEFGCRYRVHGGNVSYRQRVVGATEIIKILEIFGAYLDAPDQIRLKAMLRKWYAKRAIYQMSEKKLPAIASVRDIGRIFGGMPAAFGEFVKSNRPVS